jgi:hypothetical protein
MLDIWTILHLSRTTKRSFKNRIVVSKKNTFSLLRLEGGVISLIRSTVSKTRHVSCLEGPWLGKQKGRDHLEDPYIGDRKTLKGSSARAIWNVTAHAQKTDFVFRRNGRVYLNRRGRQFSAAKVCASAAVMLDISCSEVVWRVLVTHAIRQFPLHFPSRASPCAITFQLESTSNQLIQRQRGLTTSEPEIECSQKRKLFSEISGFCSRQCSCIHLIYWLLQRESILIRLI